MSDLYGADNKKLKFSWTFFLVHFVATYMLASLAVASSGYIDIVKPIVDIASSIFPSINGMGALSPDAPWGSVYFMLCLLGSPIYIRFFWRAAGLAYPAWVREQGPFRFWLIMLTMLILSIGILFLLKPSRHSYTSVRAADFIDLLMKNSNFVYGLVAMLIVIVLSLALGACAKAIQLRISNRKNN